MGFLGGCVAIEEIARVCSNSPLFIVLNMLSSRVIDLSGTQEQKDHYMTGPREGRTQRLLRPHRTPRGLGRGQHPHARRQGGRRVGHQRNQVLLHGARQGGLHHRRRQDRPPTPARAASPTTSCPPTRRASASPNTSARWACAASRPACSTSTTWPSRSRTRWVS